MRTLLTLFMMALGITCIHGQSLSTDALENILNAEGTDRLKLLADANFKFAKASSSGGCLSLEYAQANKDATRLIITICEDGRTLNYGSLVVNGTSRGSDALFCEKLLLVSQSVNNRFEPIMGEEVTGKGGAIEKWDSEVELSECENAIYPIANYRIFSAECAGNTTKLDKFIEKIDGCLDILPGWQIGGNGDYSGHYIDDRGNEIRLVAGASEGFKVDVYPGL